MVKTPPAMWETWVRSLGCEDPLEESTDHYRPKVPIPEKKKKKKEKNITQTVNRIYNKNNF